MAQTSSHSAGFLIGLLSWAAIVGNEDDVSGGDSEIPWLRHSHATFHASRVAPSKKSE